MGELRSYSRPRPLPAPRHCACLQAPRVPAENTTFRTTFPSQLPSHQGNCLWTESPPCQQALCAACRFPILRHELRRVSRATFFSCRGCSCLRTSGGGSVWVQDGAKGQRRKGWETAEMDYEAGVGGRAQSMGGRYSQPGRHLWE